jgi:hypothetical protein
MFMSIESFHTEIYILITLLNRSECETDHTLPTNIHKRNHCILSSARCVYLVSPHLIYLRSILILSYSVSFKKLKIKTYKAIIFIAVMYGCETWSLTLREETDRGSREGSNGTRFAENSIKSNFRLVPFSKCDCNVQVKDDEVDRACG